MYDIILSIIDHVWATTGGTAEQSYVFYICGALICLLVVVFVDIIRDIFSGFFRG